MQGQLGDDFGAFCAALESGERAAGLRHNPLEPVPWEPGGFYVPPEVRPGTSPLH